MYINISTVRPDRSAEMWPKRHVKEDGNASARVLWQIAVILADQQH